MVDLLLVLGQRVFGHLRACRRILSLYYSGPQVLRVLLLRRECKLALDSFFLSLGLLEFDNKFPWGEPVLAVLPLVLVYILQ